MGLIDVPAVRGAPVIWWVRRDLRLSDNQALNAALAAGEVVAPVFVLDPVLLQAKDVSDKRIAFLFGGLRALDAALRERGSRLIVRWGDPAAELTRLAAELGAGGVYAEEDPWPYARQRDVRVAERLPLHLAGGLTLHPVERVVKADGSPYTIFTPYSRAWKALPMPDASDLLSAPTKMQPAPPVAGLAIPDEPALVESAPFPPGEPEAERRLRVFTEGESAPIFRYGDDRNRMDLDGTSQLSPYLRFGMISARRAVVAALRAVELAPKDAFRKGAETWLNELIWREFYMAILYHYPFVLQEAFRPELRDIRWSGDRAAFSAWCQGRTGFPAVDAAMRQLVHTGWMHNRARMIVASFLVKDLLIDWRWGERFFMQHLVDGDPAANNGGWQWTAGVGTDAAPYFRIFNPTLQGARFDPAGEYVRQWVPELARVPAAYIHEPQRMPAALQHSIGCIVGRDYPAPIVDHAWARGRTLAAYRQKG
jgi:deoxyribodipyrimidine photo-lyase